LDAGKVVDLTLMSRRLIDEYCCVEAAPGAAAADAVADEECRRGQVS